MKKSDWLEQKRNWLEQSNQGVIDLSLWREAKALTDLKNLLNPDRKTTVHEMNKILVSFDSDKSKTEK